MGRHSFMIIRLKTNIKCLAAMNMEKPTVQPQGGRSWHPPHFTPKVAHFMNSTNMLYGVNNKDNYYR